jgi:hypothetical protein
MSINDLEVLLQPLNDRDSELVSGGYSGKASSAHQVCETRESINYWTGETYYYQYCTTRPQGNIKKS